MKKIGKIIIATVTALALVGAVVACGKKTTTVGEDTSDKIVEETTVVKQAAEGSSTETTAGTQQKNYEGLKIRVGGCDFAIWNPQVNVALHEGLFEEEFAADGISIETYNFVNGPAGNEAIAANELDIFNGTGDQPFVNAVANGVPVVLLSTTGQQGRGNQIVVHAESDINTLTDIKGKRIGLFIGTQQHKTWLQILAANGLTADDVELVNLQNFAEQNAAFVKGDIDVFYASNYNYDTITEENVRSIGTLEQFPSRCFITAREGFAEEYPELVQRFFNVLVKAQKFIEENPEKTYEYLAEDAGLSYEEVEKTVSDYDIYLALDDDVKSGVNETYNFLLDNDILEIEIDNLNSHFNDTFVNNAK